MGQDRINNIAALLLVSLMGCAATPERASAPQLGNPAPQAPAALKLMILPDGISLAWGLSPDDPAIVTGYEIFRADVASGPFLRVGVVGKGVSRYADKTAAPEHIYYYRVRAVAGPAYSDYSNTVTGERTG